MSLSDLGRAFVPETPNTVMPFAVQSVLSARIAEMAATFMKTGERPGEKILAESKSILPLFGPMLEAMYGRFFEEQILLDLPVYKETDKKGGLVVDLGCGNGWYLRKIAALFPRTRGIGIDAIEENISQARKLAQREGLADRLTFRVDDIHQRTLNKPSDLIAMNRALHHVWDEREAVFQSFKKSLRSGGSAVIWEPNWPKNRSELRNPGRLSMAFQNLAEYIQGNRFLRAEEIEAEFHRVGMETDVRLFADGNEAVIVGRKI
ncbi:MAG: class I SAM-dependent methyltransferase [Armatimonadetes bacterium]|nr:class I SAM-dependent methyltransferase [Armatimonadota bacterium]